MNYRNCLHWTTMQIMSKGLQGVMRSIHSFDLFSVCTLRSFKEKIGGLEPLGQIVLSLESSWEYWWGGLGSHRLGDRGTELEPVAHREEQGAGKTHIWDMTLKLQRLRGLCKVSYRFSCRSGSSWLNWEQINNIQDRGGEVIDELLVLSFL